MKISLSLLSTVGMFLSVKLYANSLWCGKSYRFESFSYGIATSLDRERSKPIVIDELCWRMGKRKGHSIKNNHYRNFERCLQAFSNGSRDGMEGVLTSSSHPPDCYRAGVNFGQSKLSSSVREEKVSIVGRDCIDNYKKGKKDGMEDIVATPGMDNKLSYCYMTGYTDGTLFRGLL